MKGVELNLPAGGRGLRLVAAVAAGMVALRLLTTVDASVSIALDSLLLFVGLALAVTGAAGLALLSQRGVGGLRPCAGRSRQREWTANCSSAATSSERRQR